MDAAGPQASHMRPARTAAAHSGLAPLRPAGAMLGIEEEEDMGAWRGRR